MADPFRYDQYRSPYVGSISQLIAAPGEAYARAAEIGGNAQAAAAQQRGAAWGNAIGNIGQSIAAIPQQIQQYKANEQRQKIGAQQLEAGGLALGEQKRAIAARDEFAKIIKDTPQLDEGGVSLYDIPLVARQLAEKGQDPAVAVEHLGALNNAFRAENAAKLALVKTGAASVAAAGNDPVLAGHFLDQLERNRSYPKEQIQQFRDIIDADPANVAKLTAYLMGPQKMERGAPGSVAVNPVTGIPVPGSEVKDNRLPTTASLAMQAAGGDAAAAKAMDLLHPKPEASWQHIDKLLDGKPSTLLLNPKTQELHTLDGAKIDNAASRVRPIPPASLTIRNEAAKGVDLPSWAMDDTRPAGPDANKLDNVTKMTPNGLFQAAQNFIANGQYPPTGRGSDLQSIATRTAINAKVGAIAASAGMDVPGLRAFYKSNMASLTAEQKMMDALQGFIRTADKNVDLLQNTLKDLPDTGSPLFNKPFRAFEKDVAGDPKMSAFSTYLKSVQNEYARIVAQPNLVGQLTDTARHEAEQLISDKATVPQILASIQALKNEGDNRVVSVGEQIQRIQKRMEGHPPPSGTTPTTPPTGATYHLVNGQWVKQ